MERDYARGIKVVEIEQPMQRIIINGVEQTNNVKAYAIACPNCGRVIMKFNQGMSDTMVHKYIDDNSERLENDIRYCPSCGQRLSYPKFICIDASCINEA